MPDKFCEILLGWRNKFKLTQQMASAELSVGMRSYQDWELGIRSPHPDRQELVKQRMDSFRPTACHAMKQPLGQSSD